MSDLALDTQALLGHLVTASQVFAALDLALSKTAVSITLYRFALRKWQKGLIIGLTVPVDIIMGLAAVFMLIMCRKSQEDRRLIILYPIGWSAATDFIHAFLAWPMAWSLHMNTNMKLGQAVCMSLGIFSGITALFKTSFMARIGPLDTPADYIIWNSAESAVIIAAASILFCRQAISEDGIMLTSEATVLWDPESEGDREIEAGLEYAWSVTVSSPASEVYERQICTVRHWGAWGQGTGYTRSSVGCSRQTDYNR
ncbi:hypothetical protein B0T25DRAFT_613834 [Lasiosphaeria hispida]|uniref:Integral membrane protein n=1 Tax=Lasiosphaeria hispida TaxID=260671 RepID=A0AAJ0MBC6_9PEZI|nr:hypothetical protein B0T25DRAFT_613834 [Lasiosphaeria hispida]